MVSPFDVLGLDDDADEADVERAYRERVKEAHPDQGGTVEEFQLVRRAYRELGERDRNGDADDETDPADIDLTDEAGEVDAVQPVRVEFLDYEAIDDYGWSLDDDDLFRKASHADLDPRPTSARPPRREPARGGRAERLRLAVLLSWRCVRELRRLPRGRELSQPADHIMPEELAERGFRLSCNGYPVSDELKVVFNVKQLAELDDLILPPGPFTRR